MFPTLFSALKNPQRSPEATPPVFFSPAAALDNLFEHPDAAEKDTQRRFQSRALLHVLV
jgi:hypothetical protein